MPTTPSYSAFVESSFGKDVNKNRVELSTTNTQLAGVCGVNDVLITLLAMIISAPTYTLCCVIGANGTVNHVYMRTKVVDNEGNVDNDVMTDVMPTNNNTVMAYCQQVYAAAKNACATSGVELDENTEVNFVFKFEIDDVLGPRKVPRVDPKF
jgi:hypothetical protein